MSLKGIASSCGFSVGATKKGELPLKVEKRAKGKKVTVIANVQGDASKLVRALQTLLGVGGTARQAEKGSWSVEVQGDQTARVTRALLDFGCLHGLSTAALEAIHREHEASKAESVVNRTAATKFMAQTQAGAALSPEEERRRTLEMEAEFYGQFWQSATSAGSDDLADVWEESANMVADTSGPSVTPEMGTEELNVALMTLGMFAECGRAVREFWEKSGMTIHQFRKMALNPGARLITDAGKSKAVVSNLVSRQKMSDYRSGRARVSYFSAPVSAVDEYERGIARNKEEGGIVEEPAPDLLVISTSTDGWYIAQLSYCAPLAVPHSRLGADERSHVAKKALGRLEGSFNVKLDKIRQDIPGVECRLDCDTFGIDLALREGEFLYATKGDGPPAATKPDKEELRVEKKLREISSLRRRQLQGEKIEKLQAEKIAKRVDLFKEVAEMRLRRVEKEIMRVFKGCEQDFRDTFWDLEWKALYGDGAPNVEASDRLPFGTFDASSCEGAITVSSDGLVAESRAPRWVGLRLHLSVLRGEVGAFAIEVLEGLVRLGWASPSSTVAELGTDQGGFGFGSTGKRVNGGTFEQYGDSFGSGDVVHCEAEREDGNLRIGFAKNNEPLGVAFEVVDPVSALDGLVGAVSGKAFKVRLLSAESMPLQDAPGLDKFIVFDPPRMAIVVRDFLTSDEEALQLRVGETVHVASDDGEGWLFGFFLDPEDPDDGGWFKAECVQFWDVHEVGPEDNAWPPPASLAVDSTAGTTSSGCGGPVAPAASGACMEGAVEGLGDFLRSMSLRKYEEQASAWCIEMGAVSLAEVFENWEALADALALKPLERKRLAKAVTT